MNEDIIARWVAAEMVAEGVVIRKDGVLIVSASGREFMIEVRAHEVTESQVDARRLTEPWTGETTSTVPGVVAQEWNNPDDSKYDHYPEDGDK